MNEFRAEVFDCDMYAIVGAACDKDSVHGTGYGEYGLREYECAAMFAISFDAIFVDVSDSRRSPEHPVGPVGFRIKAL